MKAKNGSETRKTVEVDVTEWFHTLSEIAKKECRTVVEQCRYFIKQGIEGVPQSRYGIVTYSTNDPWHSWPANDSWQSTPTNHCTATVVDASNGRTTYEVRPSTPTECDSTANPQ